MNQVTNNSKLYPVALTIAGSDSGGGAGIQADLRAFSAFGVFGTTAITALTAQNPQEIRGIQGTDPEILRGQIEAVRDAFQVGAVKTGMLYSASLIAVIAEELFEWGVPLVADPVMVATSGATLLQDDAVVMLVNQLLPRATLITPNIPEAEILTSASISSRLAAIDSAKQLARSFDCAVLVKGGHFADKASTDILACSQGVWEISGPVVDARSTHGTGCSLSAACAAVLAGNAEASVLDAVVHAKAYVTGALANARQTGRETWAMCPPADLPLNDISVHRIGD